MKISNYRYNYMNFNVNFEHKINILKGYSGSGKTFLLRALRYCFDKYGISYAYTDYAHRDTNLEGKDVLLFDNGDLYFDKDMLAKVSALDAMSIIVMHSTVDLSPIGDMGCCYLINDGKSITTKMFDYGCQKNLSRRE